MPDSDKLLSHDELLQETIILQQQVAELKAQKADLELLQEVTTEHSDDVLADLHRKNKLIRKIFGRYLTDKVVTTLLEQPTALKLGGKRQIVSVLVADLRGFTALSENLSAEDVIKVLNWFLGQMTDVITQHEGTINDFTGDGIMVLFGAPTIRADDAQRAVTCAIAMQMAMTTVNQKMTQWNLPKLKMGIGINTGEAVVGNIGSEKHTKYSAIGKQVNLAYRIESYTVGGQILISEQTLKNVHLTTPSAVIVEQEKQIHPKGLSQPITVLEVKGIDRDTPLFLSQKKEVFHSLPEALSVKYAILEGKQIGHTIFEARLVTLSEQGAELQIPSLATHNTSTNAANIETSPDLSILLMSDLKLNIWRSDRCKTQINQRICAHIDNDNNDGEINYYSADIYAKVLSQNPEKRTVYIHFTSLPPDEASYLTQLYQAIHQPNLPIESI